MSEPAPVLGIGAIKIGARAIDFAATAFAVAGLAHFLPIVIAIVIRGTTGGWWMAVLLGLVERGMAACEIAALVCLAV